MGLPVTPARFTKKSLHDIKNVLENKHHKIKLIKACIFDNISTRKDCNISPVTKYIFNYIDCRINLSVMDCLKAGAMIPCTANALFMNKTRLRIRMDCDWYDCIWSNCALRHYLTFPFRMICWHAHLFNVHIEKNFPFYMFKVMGSIYHAASDVVTSIYKTHLFSKGYAICETKNTPKKILLKATEWKRLTAVQIVLCIRINLCSFAFVTQKTFNSSSLLKWPVFHGTEVRSFQLMKQSST